MNFVIGFGLLPNLCLILYKNSRVNQNVFGENKYEKGFNNEYKVDKTKQLDISMHTCDQMLGFVVCLFFKSVPFVINYSLAYMGLSQGATGLIHWKYKTNLIETKILWKWIYAQNINIMELFFKKLYVDFRHF